MKENKGLPVCSPGSPCCILVQTIPELCLSSKLRDFLLRREDVDTFSRLPRANPACEVLVNFF